MAEEPESTKVNDVERNAEEKDERNVSNYSKPSVRRLVSTKDMGMENSILKFKDINFIVGSKDKKKNILTDVAGSVKFGRVLAIMGPSGAGKTTLLNALTLTANYGTATGSVKLNGHPLTAEIFKQHCYIVPQFDKLWPYLTCRETLEYAAQLYHVVDQVEESALVNEVIEKMGLQICADTPNARLSGGQRRRLSIGTALVKQPVVLFLDEPTTGLDAASSMNVMSEIVRVSKEENLITICTIHQPSTKVYNNFDQIFIMSQGRTAFSGDVKESAAYFDSIGHPIPPATNPAEFFLDLVNSDFSDEAAVLKILDLWEEKGPGLVSSHHSTDEEDEEGVINHRKKSMGPEIMILMRRHFKLIMRDPILYIGRSVVFFFSCIIFALVYLKAREPDQAQISNKFWICVWLIAVPTQMGVVAVYSLNDEFKALLNETKNGMVTGFSYVLAKGILVLPIMFLFALFSLGVAFYGIMGAAGASFGNCIILFACNMFVFESVAECLSVWFDDPILGMLQFMNFWFGAFLFGGFLIPLDDLYWPFELFYYVMPYQYFMRSFVYNYFIETDWDSCDPDVNTEQAVCLNTTDAVLIMNDFGRIYPLIESDDNTGFDIVIIIVIGVVFKLFYIIGVIMKTNQASKFEST
mmetsp:Transcript_5277/g.6906  ORF Transcript_5277/g.6906 Transcript_5277/m.6906 type:complete len:638 (-) Transcript_5277:161-2074(-)